MKCAALYEKVVASTFDEHTPDVQVAEMDAKARD